MVHDGISFNKKDILHNLTLFLYPDDSDDNGRKLRIFQQYFMVSNAAQFILDEATKKGCNLHDLADYAVIQINDTHPSMVIPELIRLLMLHDPDPVLMNTIDTSCISLRRKVGAAAAPHRPPP